MSCLNLGKRLQPAKKAWKIFTTKFHSKVLHKLNRSKPFKKPNKVLKNRAKTTVPSWPYLTFQPRLNRKKRTTQTTPVLRCHHHQKRLAPVYIDELFIEPDKLVPKEHLQPPITTSTTSSKNLITDKCPTGPGTTDNAPGTSREGVKVQEAVCAADDMWESLGLASPLMHGINERAEEFITRIRTEMQLQETGARRL